MLKLSLSGYSIVKYWTKISGSRGNYHHIRDFDKIFIPINISNSHWVLAVIFMIEKKISYYDSLNDYQNKGNFYLHILKNWIKDEVHDKCKEKIILDDWKLVIENCPKQDNGCDCGLFVIYNADYLSRNLPLNYNNADIDRLKVAAAILGKKARPLSGIGK